MNNTYKVCSYDLSADFISYLTDKEELLDAVNKIDTLDIKEEYTTGRWTP